MVLQGKRLLCQSAREAESRTQSDGQDGGPPIVLVCAGGGAGDSSEEAAQSGMPKTEVQVQLVIASRKVEMSLKTPDINIRLPSM